MENMYHVNATDAIHLRMVSKPQDVSSHNTDYFKPLLTHQIFGDQEIIFGYRNLIIDIYYTSFMAECFVDLNYTDVFKPKSNIDPHPDDIYEKLRPWLPKNFCTNKDQFLRILRRERAQPIYGDIVDAFSLPDNNGVMNAYKITQSPLNDQHFREFHSRFETFIIFYIDAANFIDLNDPKWNIYYVYEVARRRGSGKPIGFCTVYNFYSYPDKIKPRISQFFVIPPYQRCGIGMKLLSAVYSEFQNKPTVKEFTVEKPNAMFTLMRNYMDCKLTLTLPEFAVGNVLHSYSRGMKKAAQQKYKFNSMQIAKIYRIILFFYAKDTTFMILFEKHMKKYYHQIFKSRFIKAKRKQTSGDKLRQLREIVEDDFMTNKSIDNKYKEFMEEITPTVIALSNS